MEILAQTFHQALEFVSPPPPAHKRRSQGKPGTEESVLSLGLEPVDTPPPPHDSGTDGASGQRRRSRRRSSLLARGLVPLEDEDADREAAVLLAPAGVETAAKLQQASVPWQQAAATTAVAVKEAAAKKPPSDFVLKAATEPIDYISKGSVAGIKKVATARTLGRRSAGWGRRCGSQRIQRHGRTLTPPPHPGRSLSCGLRVIFESPRERDLKDLKGRGDVLADTSPIKKCTEPNGVVAQKRKEAAEKSREGLVPGDIVRIIPQIWDDCGGTPEANADDCARILTVDHERMEFKVRRKSGIIEVAGSKDVQPLHAQGMDAAQIQRFNEVELLKPYNAFDVFRPLECSKVAMVKEDNIVDHVMSSTELELLKLPAGCGMQWTPIPSAGVPATA